jgi:hypothetical protein
MLCVTLANAGVLQAVHMHQHSARYSDSPPAERHPANSHHDPGTCSFCIHFASGHKTVSPDFGTAVCFTPEVIQEVIFLGAFFAPSVPLSSLPARAPPSVCL